MSYVKCGQGQMQLEGVKLGFMGNSLVNMYFKCGCIFVAWKVCNRMSLSQNVVV
jgi:pentatricopeptide repeat protein